jgi:hypothetical protein
MDICHIWDRREQIDIEINFSKLDLPLAGKEGCLPYSDMIGDIFSVNSITDGSVLVELGSNR